MSRGGNPQDMEIAKSGKAVPNEMKMQVHAISTTTRKGDPGLTMLVFVSKTIDTFKTPLFELRKNDREERDIGRASGSTVGFLEICCERSKAISI
jgi:hypothetical protein